jgi:hypothetical protein
MIATTNRFYLLFVCTIIFACSEPTKQTLPVRSNRDSKINKLFVDSAILLVQHGDMVFRRGADAISELFSNCNLVDKSYSHCGIVLRAHDTAWVYHCIGGEDNPEARMRRENLKDFFDPRKTLRIGVYGMPLSALQVHTLDSAVRAMYLQKPKFDMQFDLTTDSQLYCAEFLYKAYRKAVNDSIFATTSIGGRTLICPDNIFLAKNVVQRYKQMFK